MDWAAFIVGLLAFIGVIINIIFNIWLYKNNKKDSKRQFDDKYSREIITNSRKEWLNNMKSTLSEFFACAISAYDIAFEQDLSKQIKVSELYYKLIFNLNPIGKIDRLLRNMLKIYFDMYNQVFSHREDDLTDNLKEQAEKIEIDFAYYFKTEWQRIQDYAKNGEQSNFDFEKEFIKIKTKGDKQFEQDIKEGIV